jgi:hypothetical protein
MVSRKKTSKRKSQRLYKMRGCNKKSRKNYLGGDSKADMNLAYPSNNVKTVPNPFLAYTGKGGASCGTGIYPSNSNLAYTQNINGNNAAYPSSGPPARGFNFLNPQNTQTGGNCGCGLQLGGGSQKGGFCPTCTAPLAMVGGKHRVGCKCSTCKKTMKGGSGNNGISYANGLVGDAWTPASSGWPGVDSIDGNRNYLELNKYPTDPQTAMIATGAQPPFSIGGRRKKGQKGGALSNFLAQDLLNLGRQFQYGLGTAYNAMSGYSAPINPMPWKGQIPNTANLSTIRAASI